ncbi:MAG: radical SAM protein [Crenarchaeota archaeon]|nr:radical SAM protein [Thermoproteota archaeon]MDW8033545.1 radical SAM protein [Nitrososphaerota archaeon]
MVYITPFDPWRSRMCTCPEKYSFSPYTGCGHKCTYCYITSYIPRAFQPRVKGFTITQLERELKSLDKSKPISIANSSDPYTPGEVQNLLMREVLPVFIRNGFRLLIVTKSDIVVRDIDILSKGKVCVSITITTLEEKTAKRLEPNAPSPLRRLKALKSLSNAGIPTLVRLDPIVPGINDDVNSIRTILKSAQEAGVRQVTTSTYKARPDSLSRIMLAFPELQEEIKTLYSKGERIGRSIYLPRGLRRDIISKVREVAQEFSMDFATCREGFSELHTADTCDGSHTLAF